MQQSSPADEYATAEELANAVARLSGCERLRLRKKAAVQIWGTEYSDPLELLSEAVKRALVAATGDRKEGERGRPWPKNRVELPAFLSMCMESIADSSRESVHLSVTYSLETIAGDKGEVGAVLHAVGLSHPDIVEQAITMEDDEERWSAAKADAALIERHFANDRDVLAVMEGEKEGWSAVKVRETFGIAEKSYDSARRRMRRQVDRLMPGRRLK